MRRKSVSCFSKPTGKPLSEYASKSKAQKASDAATRRPEPIGLWLILGAGSFAPAH